MIDFHCHLDLFRHPGAVLQGIERYKMSVLSVTTTPSAWQGTSRLGEGSSRIRTALGLHPQLARERRNELAVFDRYLSETRFVGEIGLDGSPEFKASWADQEHVLKHVLQSCHRAGGKILSVHSRRAAGAVLDILERHRSSGVPIMHWFSGTQKELSRANSLDCWFSVGPTMLSGAKGRALVAQMPIDRVLLETDGPFAQRSGAPLKPWDIELAYTRLASVWQVEIADARLRVDQNERAVLGHR
jgi:TatD DNase family protein